MELLAHEIKYPSRSNTIELYGIGDVHLGSAGSDKVKLQAKIQEIKDNPHAYWIGMGDYCECINPTDKRFDPYSIDPEYTLKSLTNLISKQRDDIAAYFEPIKHKCICLLAGNHEETARLHFYRDVTLELCSRLKVRYGGYDAFIKLSMKRIKDVWAITLYVSHGFGSSRKSGAKVNRIEDVMDTWDADIVMLAHEHQKIACPPRLRMKLVGDKDPLYTNRDDRGLRIEVRHQVGVMTGSFLQAYVPGAMNYGEKKLYRPNALGTPTIQITPSDKKIEVLL